jgi:hypothetical protein
MRLAGIDLAKTAALIAGIGAGCASFRLKGGLQ